MNFGGRKLLGLLAVVVLAAAATGYWQFNTRAAPPRPPVRLTIAVPANYIGNALLFVASAKGYFRDEGLDVQLLPHDSGKAALDSALAGRAQLAAAADTPLVFAVLAGRPVAAIASIATQVVDQQIVGRADRGIVTGADLRGKTIGTVLGTASHCMLERFLSRWRIERDSVRVVNFSAGELAGALARGEVDAIAIWQPHADAAVQALGVKAVSFSGAAISAYTVMLIGTKDFTEANPQTLERALRAIARAGRYAQEHGAEAQAIVAAATGLERAQVARGWSDYRLGVGLDQGLLTALEGQAEWAMRNGYAPRTRMPNFLNFLAVGAVAAVAPERMTVIMERTR